MMGPLFTAEISKFSRQPLDPGMPCLVLPGIITRHAHECGLFSAAACCPQSLLIFALTR